jgi:adenylate cyclase
MLIVFPAGTTREVDAACRAAVDAALDAFANLATLNHRRRRAGEPQIQFGVGLNVGEVIYGNVGAPARLDFTVMGPAVNRTARLEGLTKTLGVPLLMSAEFAAHLSAPVRSLGAHTLKGVPRPQEVFALEELLAQTRTAQPSAA